MKRNLLIALTMMAMLIASASTSEARHFRIYGSSLRIGNRGNAVLRVGNVRLRGFRHAGYRHHHRW